MAVSVEFCVAPEKIGDLVVPGKLVLPALVDGINIIIILLLL